MENINNYFCTNKVLLKFLEPYDKYLFEGVIKPQDLFRSFRPEDPVLPEPLGPKALEHIGNNITLYVLNTLDSSVFFKSLEEGTFTFFNSIVSSGNKETRSFSGPKESKDTSGFSGPKESKDTSGFSGPKESKDTSGFSGPKGSKDTSGFSGPKGSKDTSGFSGPKESEGFSGSNASKGSKETFILLLAPQNPKVFDKLVELFYNKVKEQTAWTLEVWPDRTFGSKLLSLEPKQSSIPVYVFNSSCIACNELYKTLQEEFQDFPKHFAIDFSLSLSAIELFKKLRDLPQEPSVLSSYGFKIPNPAGLKACKDLYLQAPFVNLESYKNPEEISRLKTFFKTEGSSHHEDYIQRLVPLIPFVPYRLKDKIETFHLKTLEKDNILSDSLHLSLQISSRFIKEIFHFKRHDDIFPYLFSIPWTHIYIGIEKSSDSKSIFDGPGGPKTSKDLDTSCLSGSNASKSIKDGPGGPKTSKELEDDYVNILENCYNTINEIYTKKIYKTYIKDLKLNSSYSLSREVLDTKGSKFEEFNETYKSKVIKFLEETAPAIILGIPESFSQIDRTLVL
jgi:hypothetical protein